MKSLDHFFDQPLPFQGGVARPRASWTSFVGSQVNGCIENMNVQEPGEGSA